MRKKVVVFCFVTVLSLLVVFSANIGATAASASGALLAAPQETEDGPGGVEESLSLWDRTWPVLITVFAFFLFRYLRSRGDDDDY